MGQHHGGRAYVGRWLAANARVAVLVAVGAIGGGTAFAVASVPDGSGTIHACVRVTSSGSTVPEAIPGTANIRIIDPSAGQSCAVGSGEGPAETSLAFNATGPVGPVEASSAAPASLGVGYLPSTTWLIENAAP